MYAISLTSIPPRFDRLGPVLMHLLAQDHAPSQIFLCLPRQFRRFAGPFTVPDLPPGVTLLWSDTDHGPATKVLPAARATMGTCEHLIYCDDDWLMPPHWSGALQAAQLPGHAVASTGYDISRLGCVSDKQVGSTDIAQGYSGVLIRPEWFVGDEFDPPAVAWPVDDIWLSGHLARKSIPIQIAPKARAGMRLAFEDVNELQNSTINGQDRDKANRACAAFMYEKYGIWPPFVP